jgi:hypothetical protein
MRRHALGGEGVCLLGAASSAALGVCSSVCTCGQAVQTVRAVAVLPGAVGGVVLQQCGCLLQWLVCVCGHVSCVKSATLRKRARVEHLSLPGLGVPSLGACYALSELDGNNRCHKNLNHLDCDWLRHESLMHNTAPACASFGYTKNGAVDLAYCPCPRY